MLYFFVLTFLSEQCSFVGPDELWKSFNEFSPPAPGLPKWNVCPDVPDLEPNSPSHWYSWALEGFARWSQSQEPAIPQNRKSPPSSMYNHTEFFLVANRKDQKQKDKFRDNLMDLVLAFLEQCFCKSLIQLQSTTDTRGTSWLDMSLSNVNLHTQMRLASLPAIWVPLPWDRQNTCTDFQ